MLPKQPVVEAPSDLRGVKIAESGFKMGSFYLFVHPKWSNITFVQIQF